MRKSTILRVAVATLASLGLSHALADETFNYTGNAFTAGALTGDRVTASVTLNCAGACANGTYSFGAPSPLISSFTLTIGPIDPFTLSSSTAGDAFSPSFITLQSQSITSWRLALQGISVPEVQAIATANTGETITDFATFGGDNGSNSGSPGIWVSAAPGPVPGAGLLSYITLGLLGLGSLGWKRLRRCGLVL